MSDMPWLKTHIGSIESGVELVNKFYWNLTIAKSEKKWYVLAGDQTIFVGDSQELADAFIYGMALAYSVIPDIDRLREEVRPWFE